MAKVTPGVIASLFSTYSGQGILLHIPQILSHFILRTTLGKGCYYFHFRGQSDS